MNQSAPLVLRWRLFLAGLLALCAALAARYLLIESRSVGLVCIETTRPWWCVFREGVVLIHIYNGWGIAALVGGIGALFFRRRWALLLGLTAGPMGLVLYNTSLAALGLLLSLLRLVRA